MSTNISFSGAGFLGVYHVGVISCLKFYGKKLLDNITCYGGCSAGALSAIALLCDLDLEESLLVVMDIASKVRDSTLGPFSPSFDPVHTIRKNCECTLPENAYKIVSGKLFVSLTSISDWKNVIVSEFASNQDLIDALVCTTFIPFYCGVKPPTFQGEYYIDGAFSNNLIQDFDGTTITVSVFSGDSDICPNDGQRNNSLLDMNNVTVQANRHNLYRLLKALIPLDSVSLADLCRQGFKDTLKYLNSNYPDMLSIDVDIISIPNCSCISSVIGEASDEQNCESCVYSCENKDAKFSDIEREIAKEKVIKSLILPEQLFQMLSRAEKIVGEPDFLGYLMNTLLQITKWLVQPCYYMTKHIYDIVHDVLYLLIPQLEIYSDSLLVHKMLRTAKDAYHVYHDSGKFELHPSLGEDQHADVIKTRNRLLTAEKSFVALRRTSSLSRNSTSEEIPKCVSVSPDGTDLPFEILSRDCSIFSDVFEDEKESNNRTKWSSSSFAFLNKIYRTLSQGSSVESDYGSDLDYTNNDECCDDHEYDGSIDEEDYELFRQLFSRF